MSKTQKYAIETKNLGMVFITDWGGKKRALEDLNLQIFRNEIFGFLGHNGAGKTTAIKILVGICNPTEGTANILGIPITDIKSREKIGFLPENPYFYEYLTPLESLDFYAKLHNITPKKERIKKAEEILEEVGLKDAKNTLVKEFSKGMKQRLGLAQAMIHNPEVLILDEPLSGLDPIGRKEIKEKIRALKEKGKTIFFSSHVLSDVEFLCDRIALLSKGKLISIGTLDELLSTETISVEIIAEILNKDIAYKIIEEINCKCEKIIESSKNKYYIKVKNEDIAQEVKNIIENNGGILKALIPQRESLEDFYFKQTKGEQK